MNAMCFRYDADVLFSPDKVGIPLSSIQVSIRPASDDDVDDSSTKMEKEIDVIV